MSFHDRGSYYVHCSYGIYNRNKGVGYLYSRKDDISSLIMSNDKKSFKFDIRLPVSPSY